VIALGGILAGLAVAAKSVDDALEAIRSFDRTPVPGVVDVSIAEPGGYSIYQEFPGAADRGATTDPPTVLVTDPGGAPVELKEYGSFVSYDQGSLEGRGIYTFRAEQAGTFHVTAAGASGSTVAVGRGMGDLSTKAVAGVFGGVIGGAILALSGLATSILVAITVGIARGRSRRRQPIYVTSPLVPLAGAPTPVMASWPATPIAPAWQGTPALTSQAAAVGSGPPPNGSPQPAWPTQQVATAGPRPWPTGPGAPTLPSTVPNGVGSPSPQRQVGPPGSPDVAASPALAGSSGLAASRGVAGSAGVSGSPGVAGSPGLAGSSGLAASPGVAGSVGVSGLAGSPGVAGSAGVSGAPGLAGSPDLAGGRLAGPSPSAGSASPTPGPMPGAVPGVGTVPASAAPAPVGVAAPSGAAASGALSPSPGPGTRVMATTGAAVGAASATGEPTLVGPAPTLVQAGTPDGSAPTQPLSRPGDPQSLRSPVDWSRSDLELPWETEDGC